MIVDASSRQPPNLVGNAALRRRENLGTAVVSSSTSGVDAADQLGPAVEHG